MQKNPLSRRIEQALKKREAEGSLRTLQVQEHSSNASDPLIDFASNDYLGIASMDKLRPQVPYRGSTGSRLLTGNSLALEQLETKAAAFHGKEAGLFFSSGYHANTGLIPTLARKTDLILYDKLVHASMREGISLSHAKAFGFTHNDVESMLAKSVGFPEAEQVFVLVESVYSMDGDTAPLEKIASICADKGWHLIVDEAHGVGVLGENGQGLVHQLGLTDLVYALVVTYGKAFGANGGMVLGDSALRSYLINFAKPLIYTTAPSSVQVEAVRQAYEMIENADAQRAQLQKLLSYFEQCTGVQLAEIRSAVIPWLVPGNSEVIALSNALLDSGIRCLPIRYPTVEKGAERLRISIHAHNTEEEVGRLAEVLNTHRKGEKPTATV